MRLPGKTEGPQHEQESGLEKGWRGCVRFENNNYCAIMLRYMMSDVCFLYVEMHRTKAKELGRFV